MWKSQLGYTISSSNPLAAKILAENANDPDEWETDPDFVVCTFYFYDSIVNLPLEELFAFKNQVSEKEQRWGSKTVPGSGRLGSIDIERLREDVKKDSINKQTEQHSSTKPSLGYGGKFGVQNDRVDKSAVGFEYQPEPQKHSSQVDYSKGFSSDIRSQIEEEIKPVGTNYEPTKANINADIKGLKNRFENSTNEDFRRRAEEIRLERLNKEKLEKELETVRKRLLIFEPRNNYLKKKCLI
jgi:cortactin